MEMLMMLDCQKTENARTWALSATVSFDATPSLNFKNPLKLKKQARLQLGFAALGSCGK